MTDITTVWIVERGEGDWAISGGALASGNDLASAVLNSLFTDRRTNDDDVLPDASPDRRGWWGDLDQDVPIGSRLTLDVANTAKGYAAEALKWLLDDQVVARVAVEVFIAARSRLDLLVTLTRHDGSVVPLKYSWVWSQA